MPPSPPRRPLAIALRHPRLRLDRRSLARAIQRLDTTFRVLPGDRLPPRSDPSACPPGELSLVFVTDTELAQLHADFLDDPTITDVITFEGDRSPELPAAARTAGEVCISVDAALRHVAHPLAPAIAGAPRTARRTAALDAAFARELALYVIHGWLHLAGYDDLQPAKKRLMRRAEARALQILDAKDCLPAFTLR